MTNNVRSRVDEFFIPALAASPKRQPWEQSLPPLHHKLSVTDTKAFLCWLAVAVVVKKCHWWTATKMKRSSECITFSINCVLESMRKSLKTECKQLSVDLVSRIKLSSCFSISCVFDSILWEKSWRYRKSCEGTKPHLWRHCNALLKRFRTVLKKVITNDCFLFLSYPWVSCQRPVVTALPNLLKSPRSLPNLSIFPRVFTPAWTVCHSIRHPTHLQSQHILCLM